MDSNTQNQQNPAPPSQEVSPQPATQNLNQPPTQAPHAPPEQKSSKKLLLVGVLLISFILLVVVGIALYFALGTSNTETQDVTEQDGEVETQVGLVSEDAMNEISDWVAYTDSDNYFTLMYPPDYNAIPSEANVEDILPEGDAKDEDINCIFIIDTEEFEADTKSITSCYASIGIDEVYPEILESSNYEKIIVNGYSAFKKIDEGDTVFQAKYYVQDSTDGYIFFDSLNASEELLEKVVSTLIFN